MKIQTSLKVNFTYSNTNFQQVNTGLDPSIPYITVNSFHDTSLRHANQMQAPPGQTGTSRGSYHKADKDQGEIKSQLCVLNIKNRLNKM